MQVSAEIRWFCDSAPPPDQILFDAKEQPIEKHPLPALGCNVELTQAKLRDGGVRWTARLRSVWHYPDCRKTIYVLEEFKPGQLIDPAEFSNLVQTFHADGKGLVHFACSARAGKQVIELDDNSNLNSDVLLGIDEIEAAFRAKQPLIFLNACEVGRTTPALSGVGGFAESLVDMGAGAVIAPFWAVKDNIAHTVAMEFYEKAITKPHMSFAEILSHIREKAYTPEIGEDTYAAYCFYGDPLAARGRAA